MSSIEGMFERKSPASFAQKVGIPPGWFVVSHRFFPDAKKRRSLHGSWFKIASDKGTIYRIIRFSPNLPGGINKEVSAVVVDWMGWIDLWGREENVDQEIELRFSKVSWWMYPYMAFSHPDPTHRLAGELAILSVGLGLLSIVLALI